MPLLSVHDIILNWCGKAENTAKKKSYNINFSSLTIKHMSAASMKLQWGSLPYDLRKDISHYIKVYSKTPALFVCMFLQWLRSDLGEPLSRSLPRKGHRELFSKTSRYRRLFLKSTHWSSLWWAGFDLIFSNRENSTKRSCHHFTKLVVVQIISIPGMRRV